MFFAHFVLTKKGPLAKIWLAAHWDKKLTKSQIHETDLEDSVDSILQPKVNLALRTTGHLLLGVVRIYSRKAKYLLADCNEAFIKIKMAFRPGVVDLPEENREAAINSITLPDMFNDFDMNLGDLGDINLETHFSLNQSRIDEITMKEDIGTFNVQPEQDGFGDMTNLDDREMFRHEQPSVDLAGKSSFLLEPDRSHQTMEVDGFKDDGFGGVMADGILGDVLGVTVGSGGNLFEEHNEIDESIRKRPGAVEMPSDSVLGLPPLSPGPPEVIPAHLEDMVLGGAPSEGGRSSEQELQHDKGATAAGFALDPLEMTTSSDTHHKIRRKRKLVIDEIIKISGQSMRTQIEDTSDITTTLDLAPPTKRLMHWKDVGGVDKLCMLSGRERAHPSLALHYHSNLHRSIPESLKDKDDLERDTEKEFQRSQMLQLQRVMEPVHHDFTMDLPSTREVEREEFDEAQNKLPTEDSTADLQVDKSVEKDTPQIPIILAPVIESDDDDDGGGLTGYYDDDSSVGMPSPVSPVQNDNAVYEAAPEEVEEFQQEGETAEEYDERRWNKRTQHMLVHLRHLMTEPNSTINFGVLATNAKRKQAASKFYTLLSLKKHCTIDIMQSEPYGDIIISRGPEFVA